MAELSGGRGKPTFGLSELRIKVLEALSDPKGEAYYFALLLLVLERKAGQQQLM